MKKFLIVMAIAAAAFFFIQKSIGGQKDSTPVLDTSMLVSESVVDTSSFASMPDEDKSAGKKEDKKQETEKQEQTAVPKGVEIPHGVRPNSQLVRHANFTLLYNKKTCEPFWVAWQLTNVETNGDFQRSNDFEPDPDISEPYQVISKDYSHSGYDRGHMASAADMKFSAQAMTECFYMSNMCPQLHNLNAHSWERVEKACRRWAKQEGSVYVACGPIFRTKKYNYIGQYHQIAVPDAFFKVVLSLQKGKEKAIGFVMNNSNDDQPMKDAAMSVDDVEKLTGFDFFASLPDNLEKRVESNYSLKAWH